MEITSIVEALHNQYCENGSITKSNVMNFVLVSKIGGPYLTLEALACVERSSLHMYTYIHVHIIKQMNLLKEKKNVAHIHTFV